MSVMFLLRPFRAAFEMFFHPGLAASGGYPQGYHVSTLRASLCRVWVRVVFMVALAWAIVGPAHAASPEADCIESHWIPLHPHANRTCLLE